MHRVMESLIHQANWCVVWWINNLSMFQYGRTQQFEGGGMVKHGFVPMDLRR